MASKATLSVLILGATGIIGRELCTASLKAGFDVCAVSRRGSENDAGAARWESIMADVSDIDALAIALRNRRFDVVVDLVSFESEQLCALLDLLSGRCDQYIFVSSATVYGGVESPNRITENSDRVTGPWSYPLRKLACERLLAAKSRSANQAYTIVRPYITYSDQRLAFGVWEAHDILRRLQMGLSVAIGDQIAKARTSLTHASDLARGMVGLMANTAAMNEDVHIASDQTVTWHEVFDIAASAVGSQANIVPVSAERICQVFPELEGKLSDRVLSRSFDNSKLLKLCPGFKFEYSVAGGYEGSIDRLIRSQQLASNQVFQGRLDRLVSRPVLSRGFAIDLRSSIEDAPCRPLEACARYSVGRSGVLFSLKESVTGLRSREQSTKLKAYGIGRN